MVPVCMGKNISAEGDSWVVYIVNTNSYTPIPFIKKMHFPYRNRNRMTYMIFNSLNKIIIYGPET